MKIALLPNLTRKNALQVSLEVCAELEKHSMSYCIKRDYKDEFKDTKDKKEYRVFCYLCSANII